MTESVRCALEVERITKAAPPSPKGTNHAARLVVNPADHEAQSPFLLLAEDWFAPPAGFPTHPHRGLETVTFALEGELQHKDHTGASGSLRAGDVQFMTAGSGILHSEMPGPGGVHSLQLWLNLPAARKGAPPGYKDVPLKSAACNHEGEATIHLYTGNQRGLKRPFASQWPMTLMDVALDPGGSTTIEVPVHNRAFAYIIDGEQLSVSNQQVVTKGDVVWFEVCKLEGGLIELSATATAGARLLIYAAEPIDEPVAFGGPFVMNTQAEIEQAFSDLRGGRLIARS